VSVALWATITGATGIVLLAVSVLPQVVHSFRKGTEGLSYSACIVVSAVDVTWFLWGVFSGVVALMIADGIGSTMSILVLVIVIKNQNKNFLITAGLVVVFVVVLVLVGFLEKDALGYLAASLSFTWRTLQLRKIVVSEDVSGVSSAMWFMNGLALSVWSLHGIFISNMFLTISCGVLGAYAFLTLFVLIAKRRRQNKAFANVY
jgi:uncharacterized protein with PQ loop repeat